MEYDDQLSHSSTISFLMLFPNKTNQQLFHLATEYIHFHSVRTDTKPYSIPDIQLLYALQLPLKFHLEVDFPLPILLVYCSLPNAYNDTSSQPKFLSHIPLNCANCVPLKFLYIPLP